MKFGVREIADVVFKAKADIKIGNINFKKGQPVLYIDSAKTSTIEGAATTVYAQGGKGNVRLIAWEGEKTLTFTVEDALLSPMGFAILSGAGLLKGTDSEEVHVHATTQGQASSGVVDLTDALLPNETLCDTAPVYIVPTYTDGSLAGAPVPGSVDVENKTVTMTDTTFNGSVFVDYYTVRKSSTVSELQIEAANFGGYYYVEASTLFRRQSDGVDMPAEITIPNVKIQSNFTFTMASSGDPSTFTFTMDAFPGYTIFNPNKQVLCAIQIVEDVTSGAADLTPLFPHDDAGHLADNDFTGNEAEAE